MAQHRAGPYGGMVGCDGGGTPSVGYNKIELHVVCAEGSHVERARRSSHGSHCTDARIFKRGTRQSQVPLIHVRD